FGPKKFWHEIRYSARTRVFIGEKSVRIVQRIKNPAARSSFPCKQDLRNLLPAKNNPGFLDSWTRPLESTKRCRGTCPGIRFTVAIVIALKKVWLTPLLLPTFSIQKI